ncbi:MAG: hypothetical protein KC543_07890 [Myxococcales bacterium]|nr:hypothetical protein [Myxococcales bacterium]
MIGEGAALRCALVAAHQAGRVLDLSAIERVEARLGVAAYGDHDPFVAPGAYRLREPLGVDGVRAAARSWEQFDRAFERLPEAAERRLFEARIAPYTRALGGLPPGAALPGDHLFLADGVLVGSWPADDWDAHIARCGLSGEVAAETGAPDHAEWISALRATLARR